MLTLDPNRTVRSRPPSLPKHADRLQAKIGGQKKNKLEYSLFFMELSTLAKMEQKRYIFTGITGLSGLH
ncbi:hypothetical protein J2X35_000566 [Mesorhizobium sp. BE184]|nr:hypothetical protein [Mesorhizobium sp. BE184]